MWGVESREGVATSGQGVQAGGGSGGISRGFATRFGRGKRSAWIFLVGVVVATLLSMTLFATKSVTVKLLPFDNKSEFQVVVDMPAGTPVEQTAAALRELGASLATVPEVTDYQAYAGTAGPNNFNAPLRQYFLRVAR